jgi:hypothetical protein
MSADIPAVPPNPLDRVDLALSELREIIVGSLATAAGLDAEQTSDLDLIAAEELERVTYDTRYKVAKLALRLSKKIALEHTGDLLPEPEATVVEIAPPPPYLDSDTFAGHLALLRAAARANKTAVQSDAEAATAGAIDGEVITADSVGETDAEVAAPAEVAAGVIPTEAAADGAAETDEEPQESLEEIIAERRYQLHETVPSPMLHFLLSTYPEEYDEVIKALDPLAASMLTDMLLQRVRTLNHTSPTEPVRERRVTIVKLTTGLNEPVLSTEDAAARTHIKKDQAGRDTRQMRDAIQKCLSADEMAELVEAAQAHHYITFTTLFAQKRLLTDEVNPV